MGHKFLEDRDGHWGGRAAAPREGVMRHAVKLAGRSCTACSGPLWAQRYSQAAKLHAAKITKPALVNAASIVNAGKAMSP